MIPEMVGEEPPCTVGCSNSQCRVVEYKPQAKYDRCPACYGRPGGLDE